MVTIPELWYPSPHYSTSRGPYNKVALHTTEGALKIRDLGSWFQNPGAQCSSHHGADNYEHLFGAYVYENHKAWTQGNANPYCLSLEMCGFSWEWSRDTWLSKTQLINNAAEWVHYCVVKYNIPWTLLNDSQAQNPDVRGICEHVNFGSWGSGHNDCGNCPVDVIFDKAKKWGGSGGSQPTPEEGNPFMSSSVAIYQGKKYYAYVNPSGKVCVNGGVIDNTQAAVKSGAGIVIDPDTGRKTVTFTNSSGKLCIYEQSLGSNEWSWDDLGWTAK